MKFFAHLKKFFQMDKKPGGVKKSRRRKIRNLPLQIFDQGVQRSTFRKHTGIFLKSFD